ncbi:MAG: hypothetical protein SGI77_20750 [Pirellulaceae bacterium]|nr:hypothetical protein [Pirellulaceae bacterium]
MIASSFVPPNSIQPRKYLSVDALTQGLRERFEAIPDPRRAASTDYKGLKVKRLKGVRTLFVG